MCGLTDPNAEPDGFLSAMDLASGPSGDADRAGGRAFVGWAEQASVRRAPRRLLAPEDAALDMFPRALVAHLGHPIVRDGHPETVPDLLVLALYRHLDFTTNLETLVVNETTLRLISGAGPVALSGEERVDAYRLFCDEGFHALFCADLARQVAVLTGRGPAPAVAPAFLRRVRTRRAQGAGALERFLFTAVSEMLITGALAEARRHDETPAAVRGVFTDHAADEYRHRLFYTDLLGRLLHEAGPRAEAAAALLPDMIMDYMAPDTDNIVIELMEVGLAQDAAEQVCAETYGPDQIAPYVQSSSAAVLTLLGERGLDQRAAVADRLHATRLMAT
jgi:hypothetical protein